MYGTVAKIRIKPGAEAELERLSRGQIPQIAGFEFEHVFVSDEDPQEAWMVVGFTDKASYQANAESPEQHQRYLEYVKLFEGEPEWHDGEIAYSLPA
jgi:quinol monooxygenase YgiN